MKKPTMIDVAKYAGVSQSTVSFVLNNAPITISEEARQRIYNAVKVLGYEHKARTNKKSQEPDDKVIALIIPNTSNYFYMDLIKNIGYFLNQKKYTLFILNTNRNKKEELSYLKLLYSSKNIAGIIYGFTPSISDFSKFTARNIPVIVVGEMDDPTNISLISLDSRKSGEMVANHLLNLGHKDIVYITSPPKSISLSRARRLNGIEHAMQGKANLIVLCGSNETEFDNTNYEFSIGYSLTKEYFRQSNPTATAFVGANDMIAFGIIKALNELNIQIPQQVSVCGFDNILLSSLTNPSLTTIDHCTYSLCFTAVEVLDYKIKQKGQAPSKIHYEPVLIVRDSSGAAPK